MFTDKVKEKFIFWYNDNILSNFKTVKEFITYSEFIKLPLSMQWGVIEDFAESEGYYIDLYHRHISVSNKVEIRYDFDIYCNDIIIESKEPLGFSKKDRARLECIKQLNKLINDKI